MAGLGRLRPYVKLAVLVAMLLGAALAVRATPAAQLLTREGLLDVLGVIRGSTWAPVVFVAGYTVATALALPGSVLTIAGGALFGFWWGSALNTIGANCGANAAFALSRWLGREGIGRLVGRRLTGLDRATARHGFLGLLILRLIPLVPFNALNFGSGLTAMRWRHYAWATVLGIVPGTLVYTFFADALVQGSTEATAAARTRLWIAAGLLVGLTLLSLIGRHVLRRKGETS